MLSFVVLSLVFVFYPLRAVNKHVQKYSLYSSQPLTLDESVPTIDTKDSRAQAINNIYKFYKCPMEGLGETMVREADKNNIPWWVVSAISFQESSCGKNSPVVDGEPSYNAWGYAVYGGKAHPFVSWVKGTEVMSKYLSNRFYSQGITELDKIMKVYTPPSDGSWARGVDYFGNMIQNYSTE